MKIYGETEAQKAIEANTTPRMLRLGMLRRYVTGDQYQGRPKWTSQDCPVWDREPAVIWMAPEGAITSNEDLLLADGRYPTITTRTEEDESESESDEALDEESSKKLDFLLRNIEREAKLRPHNREAYKDAQSVGTCVGLFGARNGRLFAETIQAEYATVEFDYTGNVTRLTVQYPYLDISRDHQGAYHAKALLFRRVIDEVSDTTFLPGEARQDGIEPSWFVDKTKTAQHNLGFCPVIYHKFRLVSSIVNDTDGKAIHAQSTDELDAFNLQASIRHNGAINSLPQRYECGVEPGFNPTEPAQAQGLIVYAQPGGGSFSPHSPPKERFVSYQTAPHGARRAGPTWVWQYSDANVKVGQLELNSGALEALATTMADLRARVCEQLAWVALNPEEIKFAAALSGKALERLMARQLNRVAKDRDGFGIDYLRASYCMLLRIAGKLGPGALKTRGLKSAHSAVQSFESVADGWTDPPLSLQWGTWFQPNAQDDKDLVETTKTAYDARFITLKTAIEKLKRTFGIDNIDAYLESLKEESDERAEKEQDDLAASIAQAHAKLNGAPAKRTGAGFEESDPEGGSGGAGVTADAAKKDAQGQANSRGNRRA